MRAPFILTLLSEDGYQVFAALHEQYETLERAIEGAKSDYLKRYGGNPAFRVYHAEADASSFRHTLIEVCFDESKRRSFVALYKVLQEVSPAPTPTRRDPLGIHACARALRRLAAYLGHLVSGSGASGPMLALR
jgi:hypothetical protein